MHDRIFLALQRYAVAADSQSPKVCGFTNPDASRDIRDPAGRPGEWLNQSEAETRRVEHGYNEVLEQTQHPVRQFLGIFWGISAWMLELIMVLSAVLHKYSDLAVVGTLLVINAVPGFVQEHRAAGVVQALRRRLRVSARVLRDATWHVVAARELVPGDIVRMRTGDIVPADLKLANATLSVDQSALTGESQDLEKLTSDVLPSGSVVRRGEATAVVILTGAKTYFGRTTELVQTARPKMHIEAVIAKLVRWLFVIVGALLCMVIVLSQVRGVPLMVMLPLMLILLMSAVPGALPVMFTVSMAVGSGELAKRGVLVTRLSAAEDAATIDVLCLDKTGTITMNQLTITGVIPLDGASEVDVLRAGAMASQEASQDPIDLAFLAQARTRNVFDGQPASTAVSFIPFDAKTRCTQAVVDQSGQRLHIMKGAVQTLAQACTSQPAAVAALQAPHAAKGYRTLVVARKPENGTLSLIGLVSLFDPPRPDAKQLLADLRGLGIAAKMLTGNAVAVARQVAQAAGLPHIQRLSDFKAPNAHEVVPAQDQFNGADGFAEVFPEDRLTVEKRLQSGGHVTGMTGDGVNNAPALR